MRHLLVLLVAAACSAQTVNVRHHVAAAGGGGGITLLDSKTGRSSGGSAAAVTAAMNCAGATSMWVMVGNSSLFSGITVTDTNGDTFTSIQGSLGSGGTAGNLFLAAGITGTNGMTVSAAGSYSGVAAACFNATGTAGVHSDSTTAPGGVTTTGSVTPAVNGELIVVGWSGQQDDPGTVSVSSPFTVAIYTNHSATSLAAGIGYYVQPTAASVNCTVTNSTADTKQLAIIAALHP